jgi:hypothetical protein
MPGVPGIGYALRGVLGTEARKRSVDDESIGTTRRGFRRASQVLYASQETEWNVG